MFWLVPALERFAIIPQQVSRWAEILYVSLQDDLILAKPVSRLKMAATTTLLLHDVPRLTAPQL
ncbi:MAG: hypothetical protein ACRC62_20420 [Microcoleus sp.]